MDVDTQQHLTALRSLLDYRIRDLEAELHAASAEATRDASERTAGEVVDRKEEADAERREQVAISTETRTRDELRSCRAALRRLDDGVYGDCRDCGAAIPLARLMAQPQAERCAHCQAEHERVPARVRA